MTFYGPIAYGFNFSDLRIVRLECTDTNRGSFVDVERPGAEARRLLVEPGAREELEIEPGPVTLTFGHCIRGEVLEQ